MNEIIQRRSLESPAALGDDPLAELARIVHSATPLTPSRPGLAAPAPAPVAPVWDEPVHDDAEPAAEDEWYEDEHAAYAEAGDEVYDDEPHHEPAPLYADQRPVPVQRRRGNGGMVAAAAIVILAVVGGSGALAYKSGLLGDAGLPGSNRAPPLIHASAEPVKVAPAPQVAQDDGSAAAKEIFDRAGNAASAPATKMVSRDEQPMPLPDPKPLPVPGPSARLASLETTSVETASDTAGAIDLTGPRKVKTIKILADGRSAQSPLAVRHTAVSAVTLPQPPVDSAPETTASTAPDVDTAPAADADANASPTADMPVVADAPVVARPPARPKTAKSNPIVAKLAVTASADKPMQVASLDPTPPQAPGEGFVVQIASQKTEADAASTFKRLQSRYSAVLGGMKPSIVKAEVGDKGTFFRIRVGPMASRDAAVGTCVKLKAAGGSCMVARN